MVEKFSIPGFKLDLTPQQQVFAKTLKENGFTFAMNKGSAATVRFVRDRKYGYINNIVTHNGGVIGFTFPPKHIDASPFNTSEATIQEFESNYPGSKSRVKTYTSKGKWYLFILDVELALRVCGVTDHQPTKKPVHDLRKSNYNLVRSACIACFRGLGSRAIFAADGNIVKCMKVMEENATVNWPSDWIEWVLQNAGQIIKGFEIEK